MGSVVEYNYGGGIGKAIEYVESENDWTPKTGWPNFTTTRHLVKDTVCR